MILINAICTGGALLGCGAALERGSLEYAAVFVGLALANLVMALRACERLKP